MKKKYLTVKICLDDIPDRALEQVCFLGSIRECFLKKERKGFEELANERFNDFFIKAYCDFLDELFAKYNLPDSNFLEAPDPHTVLRMKGIVTAYLSGMKID